ncbi:MAG: hypothetical protein KC983_05590 [Phycisphaerales bacterium]|nr:hypothetical protein [Phycisphaerales bacterium]
MHDLIIFDDGFGLLGPMVDLRASFEIRTGMFTTAGRISTAFKRAHLRGYWVPPHLVNLLRQRANAPVNDLPDAETLLLINGRWSMPDAGLDLSVGDALVERSTGHVVAALLRRAEAEYFLATQELHERTRATMHEDRVLYRFPWDIMAMIGDTIAHDIDSTRINEEMVYGRELSKMGDFPCEIHRTATIGPNVVFDATHGAIIVHERATIRPNAVICGPCAIGPDVFILDHALIKANTVIGPVCKIAGEVGGTIFQGFANKAHDGHLGDSWVGKWVNFGAGTTNSNLLNTYGEITMRVEPDGPRHKTGCTYLGAIVGDHVKTAICTRLMTGSVIGTGAMIASTAAPPTTVRRFAWLTDDGERTYRVDKFIDAMRHMMARRDRTPSDAYIDTIKALHTRWARTSEHSTGARDA